MVRTEVQAGGGGDHDKHHGDEDAYGRKSRTVALHAVRHAGDRDEVALVIIVALVLLQQTAEQHGAGDEHKVAADNDHDDGDKEQGKRREGLLYRDGEVVGSAQKSDA